MTFYELLGIERSASPKEIHLAYRKKAAELHPDKTGGSTEEMAELNRAYECLKDPAARQTYDETGEAPKPNTTEAVAREMLMQNFIGVLRSPVEGDILGRVRGALQHLAAEQLRTQKANVEKAVARLTRCRDDITIKQGMNLWQTMVDGELKMAKAALSKVDADLAAVARALEILQEYEERKPLALGQGQVIFCGTTIYTQTF